MSNKKISQFTVVTSTNGTTFIPVVQGSPLFDAIISASNFADSMQQYNDNYYIKVDGTNSNITQLDFNVSVVEAALNAGQVRWNQSNGTLEIGMNGGLVIQSVGLEQYYRVKATENITNGQLCMFAGSEGNSGVLKASKATVGCEPQYIIGIATEDIASGQLGFIPWHGKVSGLQTNGANYGETWEDGDVLYQSAGVDGGLTKVEPTFGNKAKYAAVISSHSSNGHLFVRVTRSLSLNNINDVNVTETNQPIVRDASGHIVSKKDGVEIDSITPSGGTLSVNGDTVSTNHQSEIVTATTKVETPLVDATEVQSTNGFIKDGLTNTSILLAGGGDKLISDFQAYLLSNDISGDASSIAKYPSVKAIKDYCDSLVVGLLDFRGGFDASVNAYPTSGGSGSGGSILKGDMWIVTVEGTINGEAVLIGSSLIANIDSPAQLDANWTRIASGLSYTPEDEANKSTDINTDSASDVKYPSVNAVVDYAEKLANKSTDVSADGASDTKYPTTKATKTYSDTKVAKTDIETVRSQSTTKVPASKLLDDQLKLKVDLAGGNTIAGSNTFTNAPTVTNDTVAVSQQLASVNKVASMIVGSEPASRAVLQPELGYYTRVLADAGLLDDKQFTEWLMNNLQNQLNASSFFWDGVLGYKGTTNAEKIYDASPNANDAVQSTSANQPYIGGTIAPNESRKLKAVDTTNYKRIGFTQISFTNSQRWSVSLICNFSSDTPTSSYLYPIGSGSNAGIVIRKNEIHFREKGGTLTLLASGLQNVGKNVIITIVNVSSTVLALYIDGIYKSQTTIADSAFDWAYLMNGQGASSTYQFLGTLSHASIYPYALSASEIQLQHTALRTLHPEFETVTIGNQQWLTSNLEVTQDGAGNAFSEVQAASATVNIEKITNGTFDADTSWSKQTGWTIAGGVAVATNATGQIFQSASTIGKVYRVEFTLSNYVAGDFRVNLGATAGTIRTANGTYVEFLLATTTTNIGIGTTNGTATIDNFSLKEAGWADAQTVYDIVYAATTGTTAQKDLAASKASAFWSHYNNSADNGAIYGKLYNWWCAHLLDLNPIAGTRVASDGDIYQLQTYLGGSNVAGGKMKALHGDFNNSNSTNESGLSLIAGGRRSENGSFVAINDTCYFTTSGELSSTASRMFYVTEIDKFLSDAGGQSKGRGYSIRLMLNKPAGDDRKQYTTGQISTNIASGTANADVKIPFGHRVTSIVAKSTTGLTNLQAVLYTSTPSTGLIGSALETLISGKSVTANVTKSFSADVDQSTQPQDMYVRFNATKADTTAQLELIINIEKV